MSDSVTLRIVSNLFLSIFEWKTLLGWLIMYHIGKILIDLIHIYFLILLATLTGSSLEWVNGCNCAHQFWFLEKSSFTYQLLRNNESETIFWVFQVLSIIAKALHKFWSLLIEILKRSTDKKGAILWLLESKGLDRCYYLL